MAEKITPIIEDEQNRNVNKLFDSKIFIKKMEVTPDDLIKLVIREWCFSTLPRLELTFEHEGFYMDRLPFEDGDVINVQYSLDDLADPIIAEFIIESFQISNMGEVKGSAVIVEIVGVLKTENMLDTLHNRSFSQSKSTEVISKIGSELGLTPEIKVESNDAMTWLQLNQNNYEFLKCVVGKSFVIDDDMPLCFSQMDRNLTYTTIETAQQSEVKYILINDSAYTVLNTEDDIIPKTTKYKKKDCPIVYYNDYDFYNISTLVNQNGGYGSRITYFDKVEDGMVDVDSNDDTITLTTHSNKNKDKVGEITRHIIKQDITDNVHGNYYKSLVQNDRKAKEFFSSYITVVCKIPSNLKIFDKVYLSLPSTTEFPDYIHTGEYIVGGIIHDIDGNSSYVARLILFNNGINAMKGMLDDYETKLSKK